MQSARHAAKRSVRRVNGDTKPRRFRYRHFGPWPRLRASEQVAWVGPVRTAGIAGWLMRPVVHTALLTGFKSRVATLASWTIALLGRGRPQRTNTRQRTLAGMRRFSSRVQPPSRPN